MRTVTLEAESNKSNEEENAGAIAEKAVQESDFYVSSCGGVGGCYNSTVQTSLQDDIKIYILRQLQRMNNRLDLVEKKVDSRI